MIKINVKAENSVDFHGNISAVADDNKMCYIVKWLCKSDNYEYSSSGNIKIVVKDSYSKLRVVNGRNETIRHTDIRSEQDLVSILDDNISEERKLGNGFIGKSDTFGIETEHYVEGFDKESMTYKIREVTWHNVNVLNGDIEDHDIDFDDLDNNDLRKLDHHSTTKKEKSERIREYDKFEAENKFA